MHAQATCQLYAVIEAGAAALAHVEAALAATDLAALLLVPTADKVIDARVAAPLIAAAQRAGVAALIAGDADLARSIGADGVHIMDAKTLSDAYHVARTTLGPRAIVGVDPGISRHDAMTLAEAGADYIAFGAPARLTDRDKARARRAELIGWWSEIFEVPCVAFDVESPGEAEVLSAAGADFLAVRIASAQSPSAVRGLLSQTAAAIRTPATVG